MSGLTRRRRTAQQILLRRALSKSVGRDQVSTELVPNQGGIVVAPSLIGNAQQINRIPERSSSRAVRKLHRILAANPFRHLTERETAGKFPGCQLQKKDSRSWRKLKPKDKPTLSGHSLKPNEHSRGSTRSRHSSSTYPSTWQLNISKSKEEPKDNPNGSLEEIINCSILNRTPYDHKLNTPLKSDNSCQCTIGKKARRRGRKNKVEIRKRNTLEERNFQKCGVFKRLKERVYSGEEFNQQRRICKKPSKTNGNPKSIFECSKSCPYKNYGGYSPSETDIEMDVDGNPKLQSQSDYLNKIERISKPPSNVDNKWNLKLPSNTEIKEYMARGARGNRIDHKIKYIPQGRIMNRKISNCYCTKGKRNISQSRNFSPQVTVTKRRGLDNRNVSNDSMEVTSVNVHEVRASYGRNGDKILSQTSLLSSEHFVQHINNVESEDNLSQVELKTSMVSQNNAKSYEVHESNSFYTNEYKTGENPYRNGESSNDSDNPKTRTVTNYNKTEKRSYNVGKLQSPEYRQVGKRRSAFSTKETPRGFVKKKSGENAGQIKNSCPICVEAITQTSELLITYRKSPAIPYNAKQPKQTHDSKGQKNIVRSNIKAPNSSKSAKTNVRTQQPQLMQKEPSKPVKNKSQQSKPNALNLMQSNSLIIESRDEQVSLVQSSSVEIETLQESYHVSHIGTPNKEYIRQAKSGKSNSQTPQPRQMKRKPSESSNQPNQVRSKPNQSKPKGLSPKQSSSLIIESHKEQYHLVQSSSTELRPTEITAPKTKKVIRTRKRKRSRCCSCCSRCSTRKRSGKKPIPSEKTKSQVCENCQCKKSATKVKKEISKLSTSNDNCDVREILGMLQKTVAGLEKQINIRNGFETPQNTKFNDQALLNDIQNKKGIDIRTPYFPYQHENSNSERRKLDHPMGTFQNQLPDSKTSLANVETPTNLYPNNVYSGRRFGFDGGNSSDIYKTNSQIYFTGRHPVNNEASPNSVEISAHTYPNNKIQRNAMPEYEFYNKGLSPAHVEDFSRSLNKQASPNRVEPSANIYQNNERKIEPYRNNTIQREAIPENYCFKNGSSPPYKSERISRRTEYNYPKELGEQKSEPYRNNPVQREAIPENYSFDNACSPANLEVQYKNEGTSRRTEYEYPKEINDRKSEPYQNNEYEGISRRTEYDYPQEINERKYQPYRNNENEEMSRRTEYDYPQEISERNRQPYRNQEPFSETIGIANESQRQTMRDYDNQSLNQSIKPVGLCSTNHPQIEVFQQNPMARKPMTDSAYSQCSKGTTNSERQYPKEICRGPEYCPYQSLYNADDGLKNRGPVTFQDAHLYIPNNESNGQKPLPICDNSCCPYDLKNSTSHNSPIHQSYPTEIDISKCNPECLYAQSINSGSCKGPEYCPYQNNRSVVVTFEDKSRNYQDPTEVCVNSTCRETMPYSRSWENPIYPMSNRTQYYPNESELTKGKIDCYCVEKEREIPFQKGGTAYNSRDFFENPYCPKNVSTRSERRQTNPNSPQTEPLYKSSNKNQNEQELYIQELRECPEQIVQSGAVESCNYSENQMYFTDLRNQKFNESYKTENMSLNCPTRLKSSRQDDRSRGAPRITKRCEKQKKDDNNDYDYYFCENPNCPDKNPTYRKPINANSSLRTRSERQINVKVNQEDGYSQNSCLEDCQNRGSHVNNPNKIANNKSEFCENPKCPDRLKRLAKKKHFYKDSPNHEEIIRKTQRYERAPQNSECPAKKRAIEDRNKYPTNVDRDSERNYGKQLCANTKCPDKKNMHRKQGENGYAAQDSYKVRSQRRSSNSDKKHKKIPNTICADPNCPERNLENNDIQCEEDPDLYRTDGYIHQRYRYNNDINNGEQQLGNRIKVCGNSECQKRNVSPKNNYRETRYEKEVCENPGCPDKINKKRTQKEYEYTADTCDKDCSKTKTSKKDKYKMAQGRNPCDMGYDTDDLCSMDCPNRYRVLFTDLRKCKNKEKNTSRQSSGKADIYDDNQITTKSCNTCKRYVPLERDRRAINKYCNPPKIEAEIKNKSVENLVRTICISPGKEAPIFVKNRHNPLVTDPIFNSYDKHILDNFEKFKEKEKLRKCVEDCPFIGHIEDKVLSKKCSSDCSCEIKPQEYDTDTPCDCKIEEILEYEDPKKTKSKVSFLGCCTKSPKEESKSSPEGQSQPQPNKKEKSNEENPKEKTESKSSGLICLKKKEKHTKEKSKPKEKTESKSSGFPQEKQKPKEKTQSKSSGFSCFKRKEKVPQEKDPQEKPRPKERSSLNKPSDFLCFKKSEKRPQDEKIKNEKSKDASKPPSKRSGFFSWCRKSETPKEYNRKSEEVPLEIKCPCSDEEIPMPRPQVPFRCPCAPDDIDDGEVKVLYDSSFRFQKESCSCAEVQRKIYCHNNPQTPEQDTSDWYATSRASSVIACRQKVEEQEIKYCPCASANGFYKIVR
ncbi:uncharacterized protein [Drosophila takahashii]|uniref:uncharacterized protein isoform X2 n=1 Tax=Drosophila takahashii TaxID=29030 RepID=UPI003898F43F